MKGYRFKQKRKLRIKRRCGLLLLFISMIVIIVSSFALFSDTGIVAFSATVGTLRLNIQKKANSKYSMIGGVENVTAYDNHIEALSPGDIIDIGYTAINEGSKSVFLRTTITFTIDGENIPDDVLDNFYIVPYSEDEPQSQRAALRAGALSNSLTLIQKDNSTEELQVYEYAMDSEDFKILNGNINLPKREVEDNGIDEFIAKYLLYFDSSAQNEYQGINIEIDVKVEASQYRNNENMVWQIVEDDNTLIGEALDIPVIHIPQINKEDIIKFEQNPITISIDEPDPDLTYVWEGRPSKNYTYSVGQHIVRVKAVHLSGAESEYATTTFTVINNTIPSAPEINVFPPGTTSFRQGRFITMTASSFDEDGDELTYEWENRPNQTHIYNVGNHTARVRAKDSSGAYSPWTSFSFSVTFDQSPIMTVASATFPGYTSNFDIWGTKTNTRIFTSTSYQGYSSYLKVGTGTEADVNAPMITSWSKTTDGVTVSRSTVRNSSRNNIEVTWTVTNTNATEKTISLASYVDLQLGSNRNAPIYKTPTGVVVSGYDNYSFNIYLKNMDGVTDVDTIYWEKFANAPTKYVPKFTDVSGDSLTGVDSTLEFAWVDRVLAPNETQNFTIILSID